MDMTALLLARWQFGLTLTFHFWFVALTLGLSLLVAAWETAYVRTGAAADKVMPQFWGKLFIVNYAVGIVTGLVQEFQFGMNWAEFSRAAGDIFGPPLALESLTAFFVASTFIGIWVYGWDLLRPRLHLLAIWMVALAGNVSAFWILAANAFLQQPVGYQLQNGRLQLDNFGAVLTNPFLVYQYIHTVLAGLATAGMFVAAVSAYYLLHRRHAALFRPALTTGLACALAAAILLLGSGHFYTQHLARVQPMKLAAMEALWETSAPAPFIAVARIDEAARQNTWEIAMPRLLSWLTYHRPDAAVRGINAVQEEYSAVYGAGEYRPPVTLLFWSFRVMVLAGLWLIALTAAALWQGQYGDRTCHRLTLKAVLVSGPLPYAANAAGWLLSEVGRQPWLMQGLQFTSQGVSGIVTANSIWFSLLSFFGTYLLIGAAAWYTLRRIIMQGPGV